jgi:hypothetical protein
MAAKKKARDDRPNPKHRAHAACLPVPTALMANDWARASKCLMPRRQRKNGPGAGLSRPGPFALCKGLIPPSFDVRVEPSPGFECSAARPRVPAQRRPKP